MEVRLKIVLLSHLNDSMIEMGFNPQQVRRRLNFVKFLVNKYPNTDVEIDADKEWDEFIKKSPDNAR